MKKAPETWYENYKGLGLEVVLYNGHWCGYVYVPIDKARATDKAEEIWLGPDLDEKSGLYFYHTSKSDILSDCPVHGGVTFYQKSFASHSRVPFPPEARLVQVGWDYNHYMDEDRTFTLEGVMNDAKFAADYFVKVLDIEVPE